MKYILKESELAGILEGIIKEELETAINEGLGKTLLNVAGSVVSPFTVAGNFFDKVMTSLSKPGFILGGGSSGNRTNYRDYEKQRREWEKKYNKRNKKK